MGFKFKPTYELIIDKGFSCFKEYKDSKGWVSLYKVQAKPFTWQGGFGIEFTVLKRKDEIVFQETCYDKDFEYRDFLLIKMTHTNHEFAGDAVDALLATRIPDFFDKLMEFDKDRIG